MLNILVIFHIIAISIFEAASNNKLVIILSIALIVVIGLLIISLARTYRLKRDKTKFEK